MVLLWLLPFREQELIIRSLMIWHSLICTYPIAGLLHRGFVYGLIDQRAHACLFVCFMYAYRGTVWLLLPYWKNCNFWVHLINTEYIHKIPSFVRGLSLSYCAVQRFSLHCELGNRQAFMWVLITGIGTTGVNHRLPKMNHAQSPTNSDKWNITVY